MSTIYSCFGISLYSFTSHVSSLCPFDYVYIIVSTYLFGKFYLLYVKFLQFL